MTEREEEHIQTYEDMTKLHPKSGYLRHEMTEVLGIARREQAEVARLRTALAASDARVKALEDILRVSIGVGHLYGDMRQLESRIEAVLEDAKAEEEKS